MRTCALSLVLVLTTLSAVDVAAPALAAGSPSAASPTSPAASGGRTTFGIKPSHATLAAPIDARARFDYTATPGAQQPDFVAISNSALTPVHLSVYASDGFNTASDGFDLLPASRKPVDVGSWITLRTSSLDLRPGQTVVVPFTVRVPMKATPGDHAGGIVASLRTFGVDKKGDRVAIDQRVGTRVYLRIQGPVDPRLAISDLRAKYSGSWWNPFGTGRVTVDYTVHNRGNVRLASHQGVTVSGSYAGTRSAAVPDIAELLPGNAHATHVVLGGIRPSLRGHARVLLTPYSLPGDTDGRLTAVSVGVGFWAVPWALIALVVLLLLVVGWLFLRRRRSGPGAGTAASGTAPVKPVGAQS